MKVLSLLMVALAFLFTAASAEAVVAKSAIVTKTTDGTITITPVISGESTEVVRPEEPEEGGPSIDPVPNPEDPKPEPGEDGPSIDPVPNPEDPKPEPGKPGEDGPSIDPVPNPVDPKPDPDPIKPEKPCDPKEPGDCPVTNPVEPGNPVGIDPVPNPEDPEGPGLDPVKPDPTKPLPPKVPCDPKVEGDCPVGFEPGGPGLDPVPNPIIPGEPGGGTPVIPGDPGNPGDPQDPGEEPTPINPGGDIDCTKCPKVNPGGYWFEPKPDDEVGIH